MTLALKKAFIEKIEEHKQQIIKLRQRQLDSTPERRCIYEAEIDRELEVLWDLIKANSEQ